jgi:hypothetical protein
MPGGFAPTVNVNNLYAANQVTVGTLPGVSALTHGVNWFVFNPDYG